MHKNFARLRFIVLIVFHYKLVLLCLFYLFHKIIHIEIANQKLKLVYICFICFTLTFLFTTVILFSMNNLDLESKNFFFSVCYWFQSPIRCKILPKCNFVFFDRDHYFSTCIGVYILTVFLVLYGTLSTYRISYVIPATLVLMAVPQVVSKLKSSPPQKDRNM